MYKTLLTLALLAAATTASAEPWKYSGTLNDGGAPANGRYDMRLTLLDAAKTMSIGTPITLYAVDVHAGAFTVAVDFGVDLANAPVMQLKTEVAKGSSGFVALGEPTRFDPKAALAGVCWDTEGNAGTNPTTNFIGTIDNQPLMVRANNKPALRIFPTIFSPNFLAGFEGNSVDPTFYGQVISGGGSAGSTCGFPAVSPCLNSTLTGFSTVSGGRGNKATSTASAVGGGDSNTASGQTSVVGGGQNNTASGILSGVGGGSGNSASASFSTVSGGNNNTAAGNWSIAAGGQSNLAEGGHSVVSGGSGNYATGSGGTTVSGGLFNYATGVGGTVAGGTSGTASGTYSLVAGGFLNCAGGEGSFAGGQRAKVRPGTNSGAGGEGCSGISLAGNATGDAGSFVWADSQGSPLTTSGSNQFLVRAAGGVMFNTNTLPIPAGDDLVIGARPAGSGGDADADLTWRTRNGKTARVYVSDSNGSFVWQAFNLSAGADYFTMGNGASLSNGGTWTNASSRSLKSGFAAIDPLAMLSKVVSLPITSWAYKGSLEGTHVGPVAEDFKAAFGLAGDGKSISTVDADGVALAAIQGLNLKLESENAALKARLDALEAKVMP